MDLKLKTNWSYYTDVTFLYNSSSAVLLLKVSFCGNTSKHFSSEYLKAEFRKDKRLILP